MKKVSLFALGLFTSMVIFAQDQPQLKTPMAKETRFGVRGGVNLANLNASDQTATSPLDGSTKTGYNFGVLVNVPLGASSFSFQPELSYSSQGAKLSNSTTAREQDLDYLNIPLNLQWKSAGGFFVQTGPQVGFLMTANTKNTTGNSGTAPGVDNKSQFDKTDLSWSAGLGFLSRVGLGIDARHNFGLRNIREDNNTTITGNLRNNVTQISLIYHFGANK